MLNNFKTSMEETILREDVQRLDAEAIMEDFDDIAFVAAEEATLFEEGEEDPDATSDEAADEAFEFFAKDGEEDEEKEDDDSEDEEKGKSKKTEAKPYKKDDDSDNDDDNDDDEDDKSSKKDDDSEDEDESKKDDETANEFAFSFDGEESSEDGEDELDGLANEGFRSAVMSLIGPGYTQTGMPNFDYAIKQAEKRLNELSSLTELNKLEKHVDYLSDYCRRMAEDSTGTKILRFLSKSGVIFPAIREMKVSEATTYMKSKYKELEQLKGKLATKRKKLANESVEFENFLFDDEMEKEAEELAGKSGGSDPDAGMDDLDGTDPDTDESMEGYEPDEDGTSIDELFDSMQ